MLDIYVNEYVYWTEPECAFNCSCDRVLCECERFMFVRYDTPDHVTIIIKQIIHTT